MVRLARVLLASAELNFRQRFAFTNKDVLRWFPGHMGKGMKQIQTNLRSVDLVLEVHDARIPASGRNPQFEYSLGGVRPHILVLNKSDLADLTKASAIVSHLKQNEGVTDVLFTNAKDPFCKGMKRLIPTITRLIGESDRHNRSELKEFCVMVIGVPNVGKSSIINSLRNKCLRKSSAAPVGAVAGITRSVGMKIKVSQEPLIYILDSPGILNPRVDDVETGFKLALCSSMLDHLVGIRNIADYLLYFLNKRQCFTYVEKLNLKEPTDSIDFLLVSAAISSGKTVKRRDMATGGYTTVPDLDRAATTFVSMFRSGEFGKFLLDD
ncbi:Hypothetical protein NTJ_11125 [Nesidiocoris tenuis]|uniref:Mitochondrial GTPase 1 n=1 Tax=Nesidiocoris tenuis TaxID=355587 RepID=A0ABN7B551_9HEMI|nr:Hypothetical protein NTJ_11125 [Nesidiocoris tenuis]